MKYLIAGVLQLAGVAWLIKYAADPDDYYGDGTTHWEHAGNGGGQGYAVAALAIATAIAVAFLALGLVRRPRNTTVVVLGAVAYLITLYAGFFWLTVGH